MFHIDHDFISSSFKNFLLVTNMRKDCTDSRFYYNCICMRYSILPPLYYPVIMSKYDALSFSKISGPGTYIFIYVLQLYTGMYEGKVA